MNILRIGWIEFIYAWSLGAPVKTKSGKVYRRPSFRRVENKLLDRALWGIDISKWQGVVDFVKVKAMGIKFLIFRASYGINPDEKFVEYITSSIGVFIGWLFGVYHYYDPRYSPQQQAATLLAAIRPYRRHIRRVWIDLEFTWAGNYEASSHWKAFSEKIKDDGWLIGFYTRKTWWDSRVGAALAAWFALFPMWAAQYSSVFNMIPFGWTMAHIWQDGTPSLGGAGTAFPQSIEIDHDIMDDGFYVSETGGVIPPEVNMSEKFQVIGPNGLNLRPSPSGTPILRLVPINTYLWGVKNAATNWITVTHYQEPGGPITALACYAYGTTYYVRSVAWTDPVPPPPPPPEPVRSVWVKGVVEDRDAAGNVIARYETDNVEARRVV